MSSTNCNNCVSNFNVGCFGHCSIVTTGLLADQSGIHTVVYYHLGAKQTVEITIASISDPINIPASFFNEIGDKFFYIIQPDGSNYSHNYLTVDYECFRVRMELEF